MMGLNYQHPVAEYQLIVNGDDITPRLQGRLRSLDLTDNRGLEADTLTLSISDHDGQIELPRRGARIDLAIGWKDEGLVEKGSFIVDEVVHSGTPDQVSIRARSADMREKLPARKSRSWHKTTFGEVAGRIASEHKLSLKMADTLRNIRIGHVDQTEESDLNFLTRLGNRYDAIVTIKHGNLLIIPTAQATTASGAKLEPITLERADGDQHTYTVTDRDSYTGVKAYWNKVSNGKREVVIAGVGDNAKELRATYASQADAMAAAKAEWARLQRGVAEFRLNLAKGRPTLTPETPLILRGWKPEIDETDWILVRVTHSLNDSGLTTKIEAEVQHTEDNG